MGHPGHEGKEQRKCNPNYAKEGAAAVLAWKKEKQNLLLNIAFYWEKERIDYYIITFSIK